MLEQMEEQDEDGAPTPPLEQRIGGVEQQELVDIARKEDHAPAAAIAIGGLAVEYMCGVVVVSNICVHQHTWVCHHQHRTGARRRQIRLERIRHT